MKRLPDNIQDNIIMLYTHELNSTRDIVKLLGLNYHQVRNVFIARKIPLNNKIRLLSEKAKGRVSPRMGVKLKESTRNKIGISKTGNKNCLGRVYSKETIEKMSIKRKEYISKNPEVMQNLHKKRRVKSEDEKKYLYAIKKARASSKQFLRRLISLGIYIKSDKKHKELGYTHNQLKDYIEKMFKDGMSWDNRSSFHIDHIVPIKTFIKNGIYDPKIINSLANLQPLSRIENQKKSSNYNDNNFKRDIERIKQFNLHA